jgi:peptide/nickel transport system substrate-binding protein
VPADAMRKVGLNVDLQVSDWGTTMQRVIKKDSIERGGWSCVAYQVNGTDVWDPAVNNYLRASGADGWAGWPSSPRLEELRDEWLAAPDPEARKRIATEIQRQAFEDVPYVPLGLYYLNTAYRADLTGVLNGISVFWNVRRQG